MSVIRKKKDDDIIVHTEQPISLSLKVVIYLGIVSGIFLGSWEIVNNIPKYELDVVGEELVVINKINGNVYLENMGKEEYKRYGHKPFNLYGKISETTLKDEWEKRKENDK